MTLFLGEPDPLTDFTSVDSEFRDAQRTVVVKYPALATGNIEVLRLLCGDFVTWDQLDLIIYADSAGEAGAIIGYGTVTGPGATGVPGDSGDIVAPPATGANTLRWVEATGLSIPVVMGTDYWFGIHARGDGSDDCYFVVDDDGTHQSYRLSIYPGFSSPPPDPYDSTAFGYTESIAFQAISAPSVVGELTAEGAETFGGTAFIATERGPRISETFDERWSSGLHLGAAKPELRVEVRQGRFNRRRAPWNDGVYPVDATIGDSDPTIPWQAFWEPTTEYVEVPGVLNVELAKNFDQRGLSTAVISVENISYQPVTSEDDEGGVFHNIYRGWLSPLRGYVADGRTPLTDEHGDEITDTNEWFEVLNRNYQITVHEGYGDQMVKTFTGLIDDVDLTSHPDSININARCFGQALTDQEMFGWNIDKDLRDPVTFIDRDDADKIKKGGYDPSSSSHQTNHDSDLVIDGDSDTYWASNNHTGAGNTEWVEIKLAQGRYKDFFLGTKWANMDIYISIFATQPGEGEFPTRDGVVQAANDWIDTGLGTVPGGFGGIPYVRLIDVANSATTQIRKLDIEDFAEGSEFVVGPGSKLRISFRNLHDTGGGVYRAGVRSLYSRKRTLVPEAVEQKWVLVGDVSDMVKVLLRWAGFKDWEVESSGVTLNKRFLANRGMKYMDVIDKIKDSLGYEFFIGDPVTEDDRSIGIPVFRKSLVLVDEDDAPPVITVTHEDLLTAIDSKSTDEPLAYIIRARGREAKNGNTLGGDTTRRIMATYRPPWSGLGLAGLIKHVIHTNYLYKTADDVKFAAWFIALQEALESVAIGGEIPAYPGIDLDDIIVLKDLGTGLTTRLQIRERRSTFHAGEETSWVMSFAGALIDVPDIQTIVAQVNAAVRDGS